MEKPVPMPDEIYKLIKTHLGKKALDIQQSGQPLGVWVITADNQARYFPVNIFLRDILLSMPADEKQWLLDEMEALDETKEAMVMFVLNEREQFMSRVNLADEE